MYLSITIYDLRGKNKTTDFSSASLNCIKGKMFTFPLVRPMVLKLGAMKPLLEVARHYLKVIVLWSKFINDK